MSGLDDYFYWIDYIAVYVMMILRAIL